MSFTIKNNLIHATKLLIKNENAKVIYNGNEWVFLNISKKRRDLPLKLETVLNKIKSIFSKKYIENYNSKTEKLKSLITSFDNIDKNIPADLNYFREYFANNKTQAIRDSLEQEILQKNDLLDHFEKKYGKPLSDLTKSYCEIYKIEMAIEAIGLTSDQINFMDKMSHAKRKYYTAVTKYNEFKNLQGQLFTKYKNFSKNNSIEQSSKKSKRDTQNNELSIINANIELIQQFKNEYITYLKTIPLIEEQIAEITKELEKEVYKDLEFNERIKEFEAVSHHFEPEKITAANYKSYVYAKAKIEYLANANFQVKFNKEDLLQAEINIGKLLLNPSSNEITLSPPENRKSQVN